MRPQWPDPEISVRVKLRWPADRTKEEQSKDPKEQAIWELDCHLRRRDRQIHSKASDPSQALCCFEQQGPSLLQGSGILPGLFQQANCCNPDDGGSTDWSQGKSNTDAAAEYPIKKSPTSVRERLHNQHPPETKPGCDHLKHRQFSRKQLRQQAWKAAQQTVRWQWARDEPQLRGWTSFPDRRASKEDSNSLCEEAEQLSR